MALNEKALAGALEAIYTEMAQAATNGESKTDHWFAEQMAKAITNQIKTAELPSGTVIVQVSGQAVGIPNPNPIKVI